MSDEAPKPRKHKQCLQNGPPQRRTVSQGLSRLRNRQQAQGMPVLPPSAGGEIEPLSGGAAGQQRAGKNEMARITPEELDYIRTAAIGDMLGDSRAFDELGPSIVVFKLCGELERWNTKLTTSPLKTVNNQEK